MKTRILSALSALGILAMVVVFFSSCSKDDQEYGAPAKFIAKSDTIPATPTTPTPSTFKEVMSTWCQVNAADTTITSGQRALYQDGAERDSLVDREISWQVLPRLMGPDSLVVYDLDATKFVRAERTTTREGEWYASGLDSLCDITYENTFDYTYYKMEVTTHNREGVTYFSGHRSPYETALVEVSNGRFTSQWLGEIVRNDSVFNRESTIPEILVTAKSSYNRAQWILSKVVLIDHFVKMVEPEPEDTVVVPEEPEVVKADFYLKGLSKCLGAKREYNDINGLWFDGPCCLGSESYLNIAGYFDYDGKKETLASTASQEVSFNTTPKVSSVNGVYFKDGKYYPGAYTVHTQQQKWEVVSRVNGEQLLKSYREQEAISSGIRNFQGSNTARCTPDLKVAVTEKIVRGYKVITITMTSSLHVWTVVVADEALRP